MERLAGRLKWDRKGNRIRVVFPAIRNLGAIAGTIRASWKAGIATFSATFAFVFALGLLFPPSRPERWWVTPLFIAFGCATGEMSTGLPRHWTITLVHNHLWVEQQFLSWQRKRVLYSTANLFDLRFVKAESGADIRNPYRLDEIQFDKNLEVQFIAPGITGEEAKALIERMNEIYPFPKYPISDAQASPQEAAVPS